MLVQSPVIMSYAIMDAHPVSIFIIMVSMMFTPLYLIAVYTFSGASPRKGLELAIAWMVFGGLMTLICIYDLPAKLGLIGNLIVPLAWTLPSLSLYLFRKRYLDQQLSQKLLVGLQLFRVIGGIFLIEMSRGNIAGVFALPAGIGDLIVAALTLAVLIVYRARVTISRVAIWLVLVVGIVDFVSAFFFGFTSSNSPIQLFKPEGMHEILWFPAGMIPLFLVPYAIFFHTLSAMSPKGGSHIPTSLD